MLGSRNPVRTVTIAGEQLETSLINVTNSEICVAIDGISQTAQFHHTKEALYFFGAKRKLVLEISSADLGGDAEGGSGKLMAPMPGAILEVFVEANQEVTAGTPLMLMEAMKIEHTISAPFDGKIIEVRFKPGDQVTAEGVQLIVMEASGEDT